MKLFDEIPYLEDEYIIIHKMDEKDAPALEEMSDDEEFRRYLPKFLFEFQFKDKREAIKQMYEGIYKRKESLILGTYLKDNPDKLVGVAEYYNYNPNWNKVSIGGRIASAYWHRGIGEHMIALQRDYAFQKTDVKRITVEIMTDNIYSRRAIESQGFRLRKSASQRDWGFPEPVLADRFIIEKLGNIKYTKIGSGEKTMVMLPGLAYKSTLGEADVVADAYKDLYKDYTIYLFDDRDNIGDNYSIRERAGDVAAEMKTLGLKNAYVFGASMGGMTGQYLAIDHPDLVKKMVISATAAITNEKTREIIAKWSRYAKNGEIEKSIHEAITHIYSPTTVSQYGNLLEKSIGFLTDKEIDDFIKLTNAVAEFNSTEELNKIKCPVLITGAHGDRVFFPELIEDLARRIKGCELYMYGSEYGHAVYDETSDHRKRVLDFFEKK